MSLRIYDRQGRWRSLTVAFRMSPEENADLNTRVRLSGLTKQDYIIRRLQYKDVVVQVNTRVYKALRNQMAQILNELKRLENAGGADEEFFEIIRLVAVTVNSMKGGDDIDCE